MCGAGTGLYEAYGAGAIATGGEAYCGCCCCCAIDVAATAPSLRHGCASPTGLVAPSGHYCVASAAEATAAAKWPCVRTLLVPATVGIFGIAVVAYHLVVKWFL
jgi:hypothetical protein